MEAIVFSLVDKDLDAQRDAGEEGPEEVGLGSFAFAACPYATERGAVLQRSPRSSLLQPGAPECALAASTQAESSSFFRYLP